MRQQTTTLNEVEEVSNEGESMLTKLGPDQRLSAAQGHELLSQIQLQPRKKSLTQNELPKKPMNCQRELRKSHTIELEPKDDEIGEELKEHERASASYDVNLRSKIKRDENRRRREAGCIDDDLGDVDEHGPQQHRRQERKGQFGNLFAQTISSTVVVNDGSSGGRTASFARINSQILRGEGSLGSRA